MVYVLLIVGLALLIKGADWLVRGASSVARSLKVSNFVIGLTVVSFGTSLPELVVGLIAGSEGNSDLFIGNIIGSNIANILLILGVSAMICPLPAKKGTVWNEIPFTLGAAVVFFVLLNDALFDGDATSRLSHTDGFILLAFFCAFLYYVVQLIKGEKERGWVGEQATDSKLRSGIEIVGGIAGLVIGGKLAVDSAEQIAIAMGFSQAFIGLTVIAIGTSLPELATSGMAAYRKNVDIAVGNVVGSNIFNIFIVAGISSVANTMNYDVTNNFDLFVMMLATLILFAFMFTGRPRNFVQRPEGAIMVGLYVAYLSFLVYRG
ncbi:MAG: calcium/sodium antiporter [Candidatus Hydrogenedentes bacterium]|nr:calcium/sodium antiporter [Candidatus Hydrogenedentota bacterium]